MSLEKFLARFYIDFHDHLRESHSMPSHPNLHVETDTHSLLDQNFDDWRASQDDGDQDDGGDPQGGHSVLEDMVNRMIQDVSQEDLDDDDELIQKIHIFPLKNIVVFPHNIVPLTAGKEWKIHDFERASRTGGLIGLITKKNPNEHTPKGEDLYDVGVKAKIIKIIRFPDGSYGALVQGLRRFRVKKYYYTESQDLLADVECFELTQEDDDLAYMALSRSLKQHVQKAISLSPNIPNEASLFIENIQNIIYLAELVVPYLSIDYVAKQELLSISKKTELLKRVNEYVIREIEILQISKQINSEVKSEVSKQQRRYFIKEQLRLLQKELNDLDGRTATTDANELEERLSKTELPPEVEQAVRKEIDKMQIMQAGSPEYTVSYNYATCLLDIPWLKKSGALPRPAYVEKILNQDHYGLKHIKERVKEHIAVMSLNKQVKGPILLFVGPPGVGKTSLGESIAKALKRKFVRISLGGVRDEAEIRGHRRTYIGSLPGKFVEALKKAGTMDPVILLDEIDKISTDFRGDPSSALLEALDPQQNYQFTDHYVSLPIDLRHVIFLATANRLDTISPPLLDRMEIIELSGYTENEKINIAKTYLIPQVMKENGLENKIKVRFPDETLSNIIHLYTREAGVRQLRRELESIFRRLALKYVSNPKKVEKTITIKSKDLQTYLDAPKYLEDDKPQTLPIGVATGLAYTPYGGTVLMIETTKIQGSGKLHITGQLGEVMKESIEIAHGLILSRPELFNVTIEDIRSTDLHIHVPAGAIKKDGPSAGVAIILAMASQYLREPLSPLFAFTGEISLRAQVLPVGGIKEKTLAAQRYGIKNLLIPKQNEKDLAEIESEIFETLTVHLVENLNDVFRLVFPNIWSDSSRHW